VTKWEAIQLLAMVSPLRHELIHQGSKAIIVVPHQEMRHFVDDDIFKAMLWFLCKLGV